MACHHLDPNLRSFKPLFTLFSERVSSFKLIALAWCLVGYVGFVNSLNSLACPPGNPKCGMMDETPKINLPPLDFQPDVTERDIQRNLNLNEYFRFFLFNQNTNPGLTGNPFKPPVNNTFDNPFVFFQFCSQTDLTCAPDFKNAPESGSNLYSEYNRLLSVIHAQPEVLGTVIPQGQFKPNPVFESINNLLLDADALDFGYRFKTVDHDASFELGYGRSKGSSPGSNTEGLYMPRQRYQALYNVNLLLLESPPNLSFSVSPEKDYRPEGGTGVTPSNMGIIRLSVQFH